MDIFLLNTIIMSLHQHGAPIFSCDAPNIFGTIPTHI